MICRTKKSNNEQQKWPITDFDIRIIRESRYADCLMISACFSAVAASSFTFFVVVGAAVACCVRIWANFRVFAVQHLDSL